MRIDRAFVRRVLSDACRRLVVETVVVLAGALGAEVVAEDFRWLRERRGTLPLRQPDFTRRSEVMLHADGMLHTSSHIGRPR